jgi:hypothetical protein
MSYIGKSPTGTGIRSRYYYTATGGETSISGADDSGAILTFTDGAYVDVYLNGVLLVAGTDYNTSTANTISSLAALAGSDIVEVLVYDTFTVADAVKASSGGTFNGSVIVTGTVTADGLTVDKDGATVATFDRATSDGTIIDVQKDGTTVGSIGAGGGNLFLTSGVSGFGTYADGIAPATSVGTFSAGTKDLGSSSIGWRNLYLSGGVYLGGTGSANYLDDYEEGTWTCTPIDESGNSSATTATGSYTKVGKVVTVTLSALGNISTSGLTGADNMRLDGLPFTVSGSVNGSASCNRVTFASGRTMNLPRAQSGSTHIQFIQDGNDSNVLVATVDDFLDGISDISGLSITYLTT